MQDMVNMEIDIQVIYGSAGLEPMCVYMFPDLDLAGTEKIAITPIRSRLILIMFVVFIVVIFYGLR
jgi:hypothetical protein